MVRHEALLLQVRFPASVEPDDLLQAMGIKLMNTVERYEAHYGELSLPPRMCSVFFVL
jgi:RNA polymerase sigma factor for flagellar operon FliA